MKDTRKQLWIKYYIPSYLYAGLIFSLSSYSFAAPPLVLPQLSDKILHFIEYAIFGFILARSYFYAQTAHYKKYFILFALFTGLLCGFLDEIYQSFVPLRTFENSDLLSDAVGVLAGVLIYGFLSAYIISGLNSPSSDTKICTK